MPAKTIIALTDGNDTASKVPTADAARVAHDHKVTIHTVAIGDPAAAGEDKLDEAALKDVASATGGGFYRALDRTQLADIYPRLDQIETRKVDTVSFRPKTRLLLAADSGCGISLHDASPVFLLPGEAGEVARSHGDGGVMSTSRVASDPSVADYRATSPRWRAGRN